MSLSLVILSTEYWNSKRQARKELLYRALIKDEQVRYLAYIEPMCHWWRGDWSRKKYKEGVLHVFRWICPFPGERFYPVLMANYYFKALKISRVIPKHNDNPIGIIYHPYNWLTAKHVRAVSRWIFDWTDDWGFYHQSDTVKKLQDETIKQCDGVIAVSDVLCERAKSIRRDDRVFHLPNATALEISNDFEEPDILKPVEHPRIGFIGHVGPWVDLNLIETLAKRIPKYQWCILGHASHQIKEQTEYLPNIHWFGVQPFHSLSNWMEFMDVLVAPSTRHQIGDVSKIYDYFTSGKPIISTPSSPAYHFPELVKIAQGIDDWESALKNSLQENVPNIANRRKKAAVENSWTQRASDLLQWL